MRPEDENQHGSMRPNLMSPSARRSSEENILAMLERDSAERGSSSRMAWYGAGSALALVLVGALGWLAWDNGALREDQLLTPVAVAAPAPAPIVASATAPRPPAISQARAATIVEVPAEPARLAQAEPAPLVLLSPGEAAARQRAAAEDAPAAESPRARPARTVAPARAKPARAVASARARAKPARSAAPAKAHKRAAARPAPARPNAHARTARRFAPAATARGTKAQPPDPRAKKAAAVAEAPADSDVALISAILSHPVPHAAAAPSGPRLAPQP